jgi:TatD DNase family protein
MYYIDVHTHLTHGDFAADLDAVVQRAIEAGLGAIVVNGLDPASNRKILELARVYPIIKPALGIYPLDAINEILPEGVLDFRLSKFSVKDEIRFIREQAKAGIAAVGECGLDQYYVGSEYLDKQEEVFIELIGVAMEFDLPLIIHTRKAEVRAGEILASHGIKKVNFHCFGGRTALAKQYAEHHGWWFSIPSNCNVNEAFQKMLRILPIEKILTETDAPYLSPVRGQRNEPSTVVETVARLANLRGITTDAAQDQIWKNYQTLFDKS